MIAKGSRKVFGENALGDHEHNTPFVLYMKNGFDFTIKVFSTGGAVNAFKVKYEEDKSKLNYPAAYDIKSATQSASMAFDAILPTKRNQ